MLLTIIFLPLISFLTVSLFARHIGASGTKLIILTNGILAIVLIFSIYFNKVVLMNNIHVIPLYTWITTSAFSVTFSFLFDGVTMAMLGMISVVSTVILTYSCSYMKNDPHFIRFMLYLVLFIFFMFILISAGSLAQLFIGWEGVGICSYLLINFWYIRVAANRAALKALLINRIGDIGFLLGMLLLIKYFNTLDFLSLFALAPFYCDAYILIAGAEVHLITTICLLLLIGAIGKSAQIGLHTWLPSAMEGPTPVSALIHAATMVTAGIFLIIRVSFLFEFANSILSAMVVIGALTAFFAALIGVMQSDIKKIIAYSTCSQLGYMMVACGLSQYTASLFHLINHAFFKALLFLAAGMIIHALSDEQDSRKMGGLEFILPITSLFMVCGSAALCAFPMLSGFYSKDLIIELSFLQTSISSNFAYNLLVMGTVLTYIYSNKLSGAFENIYIGSKVNLIKSAEQVSNYMIWPLLVLAIGSISFGYFARDFFVGLGANYFVNTVYIHLDHYMVKNVEYIPYIIQILPTIITILPIYIFSNSPDVEEEIATQNEIKFLTGTTNLLHFDHIQNWYSWESMRFAHNCLLKLIDKGFIEMAGPDGWSQFVQEISVVINYMRSDLINQLLWIFATVLMISINVDFHNGEYVYTIDKFWHRPIKSWWDDRWSQAAIWTNDIYDIAAFSPGVKDLGSFNLLYLIFGIALVIISACCFFAIILTMDQKEYAIFFFVVGAVTSIFLLFFSGFEFIGLLFLIVYAGAIAVLFLFVLMMVPYKPKVQLMANTLENRLAFYSLIAAFVYIIFINSDGLASFTMSSELNYFYTISSSDIWYSIEVYIIGGILFNFYYPLVILISIALFIAMLVSIEVTQSSI